MLRGDTYRDSKRWFGAAVLLFAALTLGGCGDIHERSEFSGMVMGKSGDEVIGKVGKPAAVDASDPEHVVWTFKRATFDLANQNREDRKAVVILKPNGTVHSLTVTDVKFMP